MFGVREVLELAACALPLNILAVTREGVRCTERDDLWNPILQDKECAELEALLKLNVTWQEDYVRVGRPSDRTSEIEYYRTHRGDKQAARRMASVRAAAIVVSKSPIS